jgi:hypothetical protein
LNEVGDDLGMSIQQRLPNVLRRFGIPKRTHGLLQPIPLLLQT